MLSQPVTTLMINPQHLIDDYDDIVGGTQSGLPVRLWKQHLFPVTASAIEIESHIKSHRLLSWEKCPFMIFY